jgi:glutathione S-transferase
MMPSQPSPKILHDFQFSGNGYKIRLALSQLRIPVAYEPVDLLIGSTREKSFLKKNSAGQIPVLELEDGTFLRESNAILCWLTRGTHLFPSAPLVEAEILRWMLYEQSNVDKVLGRLRFIAKFPEFKASLPRDGYLEMLTDLGSEVLRLLNDYLHDRKYLVSDNYTAADISVYAYVHCAGDGGFDLNDYPSTKAWCDRVSQEADYISIDSKFGILR